MIICFFYVHLFGDIFALKGGYVKRFKKGLIFSFFMWVFFLHFVTNIINFVHINLGIFEENFQWGILLINV